jgi:hypothetical protein
VARSRIAELRSERAQRRLPAAQPPRPTRNRLHRHGWWLVAERTWDRQGDQLGQRCSRVLWIREDMLRIGADWQRSSFDAARMRGHGRLHLTMMRGEGARGEWVLRFRDARRLEPWLGRWPCYPARDEIAAAVDAFRPRWRAIRRAAKRAELRRLAGRPDPSQPDTLGWRAWRWDPSQRCLVSPHQGTPWPQAELRTAVWSDEDAVRGAVGIHARRMPRDWRGAAWPDAGSMEGPSPTQLLVTGVVERYGRYVLGRTGWRSEWVMVRALRAPSTEIGLALEHAYPGVPVYYPDQEDDDGHR